MDGQRTALDLPMADTVPDVTIAPTLDGAGREQVAGADQPLVLPIDALLPDIDGSVVLDDIVGAEIDLDGTVAVSQQGVAGDDAQAAGQDVSGMAYTALDNGVTLYYPADADITVG